MSRCVSNAGCLLPAGFCRWNVFAFLASCIARPRGPLPQLSKQSRASPVAGCQTFLTTTHGCAPFGWLPPLSCLSLCHRRSVRLAAHLALSHHIQARAGWYAVGSSCQACGLNFRTRTRLLRHWRKGKPACMKWVSLHCEAVSDTARAELDRAESLRLRRTKGRGPEDSLPIFAEVGPPPIVLGARETPRVFLDDVM